MSAVILLATGQSCGPLVLVVALMLTAVNVYYHYVATFDFLPKTGRHYICQTFNGRLGNHIFQYASIYGIAKINNLTIILGKDDDIVTHFNAPSAEIRPNRNVCKKFTIKLAKKCCSFDEDLMRLKPGHNFVVGEYLQSWKYFSGLFNEIREELTFRDHILEVQRKVINSIRETYQKGASEGNNVTLIGVHIRRGDMASREYAISGSPFMVAPDGYIHRAMDYVQERYREPVFVVCSDDMKYAVSVTRQRNVTVHLYHHSPVQDLAVLAATDFVITTVGTFSWWAGFLSSAPVIYFRYPIREEHPSRKHYNYSEFFPSEWIDLV